MPINYSSAYATPRLDLGEAFKEYLFDPQDFIGTALFPFFESPKKKATFSAIDREGLLRTADVKRAPKSAYNRDGYEASDKSFECVERGHEVPVDASDRELYASDFDAERIASEVAMWRVMVDQETAIKDIALNTTTYTTGNGKRTDVSTAWGTATADIVGDVSDACEKVRARTGMKPNVLAVGAAVIPFFLKNDDIIAAIQGTRVPTRQEKLDHLAAIFGVDRVLIGGGVTNTANEGQDATISDIWGSGWAFIARVAGEGAGLVTPCVGRSILWVSDVPEAIMAEEYEEPQTRSTIIRVRSFADELELDSNFAQLLDIAG